MLSMLRNATKGWTAKILLLLLVASFAVWGVSGSMLQGSGNSVINVGGTSVTPLEYRLAYDRQLNQLQQQLGSRLTREQADAFGLSSNVLTQLVSGAILDESGREMGLGMSDKKLATVIGDDPAFKDATGRFSRSQLQQVLRSIGMPEAQYVDTRRAVGIRNQIIEGTTGELSLPDAYWNILNKYQAEERKFNFVKIDANDIGEIANPDDATLEAYYEENKTNYVAPEFRKLIIVKLEAEDIADPSAVSEEDISDEYEARKATFSEPEKRTVEQLVFTDKDKAQAASDALASGTSFEKIVEDAGKTMSDISLGTLKKSDIPDPSIAEAAFSLDMNTPSELVQGIFGPVLLRVTEIQPGSTKARAEVEDELRKTIALQKATQDIYETHDRLEDERAAGETLADAAKAVALTARTIEAIDRSSRDPQGNIIADIPQSQEVIAEAFDTDEGVETDPVAIGSDGFVWFEVAGVTPERQKPFSEVREDVLSDWRAEERSKAIDALAEAVRKRVAEGADFNSVIAELLPSSGAPAPSQENLAQENAESGEEPVAVTPSRIVQQTIPLKRNGSTPQLPQAAVAAGFEIPHNSVIVANGADDNERLVVQVAEIQSGDAEAISEDEKTTFNATAADDIVSQLVTRLQSEQEVVINQQAINAALAY